MEDTLGTQLFIDGQFVSQRVSELVQVLHDYCPELEVKWLPEAARLKGQAAFKIIHNPVGGRPYTIRHVHTEAEFDARLVQAIIAGDQRNGAVTYTEVEAFEAVQKGLRKQRRLDAMEEANDMAAFAIRTPLHDFTLSKDLRIKEGIPFNAKDY